MLFENIYLSPDAFLKWTTVICLMLLGAWRIDLVLNRLSPRLSCAGVVAAGAWLTVAIGVIAFPAISRKSPTVAQLACVGGGIAAGFWLVRRILYVNFLTPIEYLQCGIVAMFSGMVLGILTYIAGGLGSGAFLDADFRYFLSIGAMCGISIGLCYFLAAFLGKRRHSEKT